MLAIAPAATFAQSQVIPAYNKAQGSTMFHAGGITIPGISYKAPQVTNEIKTIDLGYCNPEEEVVGVGTGAPADLHACIYMPGIMLPSNEGATIDYLNIALASIVKLSNVKIWITKDLNGQPLYSQDVDESTLIAGWNKIELDTPFELDGSDLFIGYSLRTDAQADTNDAFPVGTSGDDAPNALILGIGNQGFQDYNGAGLGKLALQVGATGEFFANDASISSAAANKCLINTPSTVTLEVFNAGFNEMKSMELKYTVNGNEETKKFTFEEPVKARSFGSAQFETMAITESGYLPIDLEITKYNDVADENAENNKNSANVICMSKSSPRVTVMEEGTGAWCGYCPRGAVGMEKLEELYGDKFIGIAVHAGDGMEIAEYADVVSMFSGFPQALFDRTYLSDPYFDAEKAFDACNALPCEGTIALEAKFTDNTNKKLEVTSTSVFNLSSDVNIYGVAYILTEDGITGEAQSNYYSGQSGLPSDLSFLANEPSTISDYVFNDVAVGAYGCLGIEGSLEGAVKDGEEKTHTYTINMPSHIKDITKVSLIALLVTYSEQSIEIVNAAEMPLKDILGVENVSADKMGVTVEAENGQLTVRANADKALTMEVYNAAGVLAGKTEFTGNATMQLPEGNVYVVRVNDGNNVVVKKVVM